MTTLEKIIFANWVFGMAVLWLSENVFNYDEQLWLTVFITAGALLAIITAVREDCR